MEFASKGYKKLKEEFLKKKSVEKFDYIYEKLTNLEEEIENKECDYSCDCDENNVEIEKIKIEQEDCFRRIDNLNDYFDDLYERLEKIEKMLENKK